MEAIPVKWHSISTLQSRSYICGNCGNALASEKGFFGQLGSGDTHVYIYICHHCFRPTYFDNEGKQMPGPRYGDEVANVPKEVNCLYTEARDCTTCDAYTASALCSRKLLMNIAVSKGAEEGLKFAQYVQFLSDKGFVPPDGKDWVDHIRDKGNEATHEIAVMNKEDAEELITFVEMLLKFIYDFPGRIKKKTVGNSLQEAQR